MSMVHIDGDHNTVVVICDAEEAEAVRQRELEARRREQQARRRAAQERGWAKAHPYLYAERGRSAFEDAQARSTTLLTLWTAVPVVTAIVWTFVSTGLPEGLLAKTLTLLIGSALVGAIAVVPAMLVVGIPAMIYTAVLDSRDEKAARLRAEPDERAARLARETAENDRRLAELGVEL